MLLCILLGHGFMGMGKMDSLCYDQLSYQKNLGVRISVPQGASVQVSGDFGKKDVLTAFSHQKMSQWHLHIDTKVDSYGNRQNQKQCCDV